MKEKDAECPNLVPQLRITGPNQHNGACLRQASNQVDYLVQVGPGVDVGYPLRSNGNAQSQLVTPRDLAKGTTTRPNGPEKIAPVEIISTVIIPSPKIELLGWIRRRHIRVLWDSESTGNYISDHVAHSFNIIIAVEEGNDQLTLANGERCKRKGTSPFNCDVVNIKVMLLPKHSLTFMNDSSKPG